MKNIVVDFKPIFVGDRPYPYFCKIKIGNTEIIEKGNTKKEAYSEAKKELNRLIDEEIGLSKAKTMGVGRFFLGCCII